MKYLQTFILYTEKNTPLLLTIHAHTHTHTLHISYSHINIISKVFVDEFLDGMDRQCYQSENFNPDSTGITLHILKHTYKQHTSHTHT